MDENTQLFVPNVTFEKIPIKNLVSNQDYQRNLSPTHIMRAAEHFDPYQINPVKVSRRDGINYVFNGQHTIEIIALVSGSRETPVWCMIYDDLSYQHEADIFANQQKYVKTLNAYEVFVANCEAGNDDQLTIKGLVESYGLELGSKNAPNVICAVSTIESIYYKYGYHVLNRVLRLIIGTWEGEENSFSANILNAVTKLVVTYRERLDEDIFKDRVGLMSVRQLSRSAKERRPGCMGYAEAMVIAYNGKKKTNIKRLPQRLLYSKTGEFGDETVFADDDDILDLTPGEEDDLTDDYDEE